MTDRQKERMAAIPQKYRGIFERTYRATKPSIPDAIRAKCLDCCCYSETEAKLCTVETCGLYALNYYRKWAQARQNGRGQLPATPPRYPDTTAKPSALNPHPGRFTAKTKAIVVDDHHAA